MKELPGIEQPSDVGEIVEQGEHLPGHGEHDLVIGDNPNDPSKVLLRLVEGLLVSASVIEEFPEAEYGEHSEIRDDVSTVIHEQQWEHIQNDHDVTLEEIRQAVSAPDELYVSETPHGQSWYMWVTEINGETVIVRGTHVGDQVRIGTSFRPDRGYEYVTNWIRDNSATKIFP